MDNKELIKNDVDIRPLMAEEIECRVMSIKKDGSGCSMLLYKNARADMRILDEVWGVNGWQRKHEVINGNLFCTISVWDKEKSMWISKQDVGVPSRAEGEKGEASDAFKRACTNLGIGRELYTAPFIWVNLNKNEVSDYNGRKQLNYEVDLTVSKIGYNDRKEIVDLEIQDQHGRIRYKLGSRIYAPNQNNNNQQNNNYKNNNNQKNNNQQNNNQKNNNQQNNNQKNNNQNRNNGGGLKCNDCNTDITSAVATLSERNYNKRLCSKCQRNNEPIKQ